MSQTAESAPRVVVCHTVRRILQCAAAAVLLSAVGGLAGTWLGGYGPALLWLGALAAQAALLAAVALRALLRRAPDLAPKVDAVAAALLRAGALALAAFLAAEWATRSDHPLPQREWASVDTLEHDRIPDPLLGWRNAASYRRIHEFADGPREFATNSLGFRDIEQQRDPTRPCVVILGDSYPLAWGSGVEDGMTPRLRADLPGVQVFNAACGGWGKDQIAMSFDRLARPLRPDVVLMAYLVLPNETSSPLLEGLRKPYYLLHDGNLSLHGLPVLFHQSAAANRHYYGVWQGQRIHGPRTALEFLIDTLRDSSTIVHRTCPPFDWRRIDATGLPPIDAVESAILAQLRRDVEASGARLLLALSPCTSLLANARDPVAAMRRHVAGYHAVGIETFDLTPWVVEDWHSCFNAEAHPNGVANQRARAALAARVRALLPARR
ncbi:MAG: SGNH/GDSL hydrolase family protein [Planctomycetes bacterium]|nr:SGNH/GDSL hydrolase family protein [Planctomycetota bacterium]MCB9870058.1 SGNH/GDSL hydrolase family protein [Planctomycetota bacterium]MCB9889493.1 SGNH/GDSL hydrolase family protein [Planctomycetota bacterium]